MLFGEYFLLNPNTKENCLSSVCVSGHATLHPTVVNSILFQYNTLNSKYKVQSGSPGIYSRYRSRGGLGMEMHGLKELQNNYVHADGPSL